MVTKFSPFRLLLTQRMPGIVQRAGINTRMRIADEAQRELTD